MSDTRPHEVEMGFWDHFDALRKVLFKIAFVVVAFGIAAFICMPWMFEHIILAPCKADFPLYTMLESLSSSIFNSEPGTENFMVEPVSLQLTSQFFIHMSSSCWAAVVFGFPFIIYYLWTFVAPGLYEREKRGAKKVFFFGNLMFYLGLLCGYFLVFPLAVRFLSTYNLSPSINAMVSLESYMDNFYTILLLMGMVFELPLVAWALGRIGLLKRSFFKKYRRHAIVALLILAAIITPTGDPFSLLAVFVPLYALWEFSSRIVPKPEPEDLPAKTDDSKD